MDVRSGLSFWRARASRPTGLISSEGDARCEIVVLGGGVTGALVALSLTRAGVDTVLVDRGEPAAGSTAASTGLLQYEVDVHLSDLAELVGEEKAVHAYRRGLTAVDDLEEICSGLDDECGFSRRPSLYFASHWWHVRRLRREYEFRRAHGFDVEWLTKSELAEISSIPTCAAIRSVGDAQVDPYRFTLAVLRKAQANGMRLYSDSRVASIEEEHGEVRVSTSRGVVSAGRIVYATGYEAQDQLGKKVGSLHSTYAVTSQPLTEFDGWPEGCLLWETARPYFYARQTDDGRAMIGGGDTMFSNDHKRDGLVERKIDKLVARFRTMFPAISIEPAFAWAGTFGETEDGLAYIGQPTGRPRAYFALGYGGNGITFSAIAARLITDLYLGRPNADAPVFAFDR